MNAPLRLLLIGALIFATLGRPTPAAAVSAGCSTLGNDGRPLGAGKLFVQAGYGSSEAIVFRFYVQGPESRTVYEGHAPESFGIYLSDLTPGTYKWMLHSTYTVGDGTFIEQTDTLATCTVSGSVVTPPLEKPTAIVVSPIVGGNATISWSGGQGSYRVVAKRLNKRGRVQAGTRRSCETTLSESGSGSCELLELRPGRWRIRTTRTFEDATSVRIRVIRVRAGL